MKTDPKYGCYLRWPEDGDDWLHPEDVAAARAMIPSRRVFRRDGAQGAYVLLFYGDVRLRVRPTLWQEVAWEGFDLGDWVEVLSRGRRNAPRQGVVREMLWDGDDDGLAYQILDNGQPIPDFYRASDLRHIEPIEPLGES